MLWLVAFSLSTLVDAMEQDPTNVPRSSEQIGYINTRYEPHEIRNDAAPSSNLVKRAYPIVTPAIDGNSVDGLYTTHVGMRKTLFALEVGQTIEEVLNLFRSTSHQEARENLAKSLRYQIKNLRHQSAYQPWQAQFSDIFDLMAELADNIETYHPVEYPKGILLSMCSVTPGGAKDCNHFKDLVKNGKIPKPSDFTMEGFLSEYDLALDNLASNEHITVHPEVAIDTLKHRLFIQLAMSKSINSEDFQNRRPYNLTVILDISGSMSLNDNTEKSRLSWSKEILNHILSQLRSTDLFSLVIFNDKPDVVLNSVCPKTAFLSDTYQALEAQGGTNLYAALKKGYEIHANNLTKNPAHHYEHRVLLISDAGITEGINDAKIIFNLIDTYAAKNIGLTTIGVGENFNEDLVQKITTSKGGNYRFAQSGKAMAQLFNEFDYLIVPIAHQFKIDPHFDYSKLKLIKAHGVPQQHFATSEEIVIPSMFLSGSGGTVMFEFTWE
jgi:Mg-chelatase subunit ChlD